MYGAPKFSQTWIADWIHVHHTSITRKGVCTPERAMWRITRFGFAHGWESRSKLWSTERNGFEALSSIMVHIVGEGIWMYEYSKLTKTSPIGMGITFTSGLSILNFEWNGDIISIDNPYSGFCEGQIVALGVKRGNPGRQYIPHTWMELVSLTDG